MAKKQTRRTVSLNRALYERLKPYAVGHGIPIAQLTSQAIEAVLDGRLQLKPPIVYSIVEEQVASRARRVRPDRPAQRTKSANAVVHLVVPPLPPPKQYPGATCAVCAAWIPAGTAPPLHAPWGRADAMVRICVGCHSESDNADTVNTSTKGYRPIDKLLQDWCFLVLRAARRFHWVEPSELAAALDVPSDDVNRNRRNSFDTTLSKLTRRGHLERSGRRMAFRYQITDAGRREYERQLEGAST